MIYFDQAASSFPKPSAVSEAMVEALTEYGANPGRGSHALARKAAAIVQKTREKAATLFGLTDPRRALFYPNATIALNQAIKGIKWNQGDHVIATSFEHNSIRRPLTFLQQTFGVEVTYVTWNGSSHDFYNEVAAAINDQTRLIAMTHASNVVGTILPIKDVLALAKENNIWTLVDASQTAGHLPINMKDLGIDMLAFPGHKGLLGPQGTGMLLVEEDIDLMPIHHGGTGSFSEAPLQPEQWPERLESGTLNTPGIAGLYAALHAYEQRITSHVPRETLLANRLYDGLKAINGVTCFGPDTNMERVPVVAFNIIGVTSQEVAIILDSHYQIAVRAGLHCSPLTHQMLGTVEHGIVRASLGIYNTDEEVDMFLQAIQEIAETYQVL